MNYFNTLLTNLFIKKIDFKINYYNILNYYDGA
jgi:hypothetical protein